MNTRHHDKKAAIIAAAFSEWGRTHFTAMSLRPIAARLSITKPALYRYFKNKDDLLQSMIIRFSDDLEEDFGGFLSRSAPSGLEGAVRDYYGWLFDFFTARPMYLAFLLFYIVRKTPASRPDLTAVGERLNGYFFERMGGDGKDRDPAARAAAVRFIQMHGVFWLMQLFRRGKNGAAGTERRLLDFRKRIARPEADRVRDRAVISCVNGYCGGVRLPESVMRSIVASCWITAADLPEPDRIFSAVEEVIGEAGLSGASVERIAERIGINKSSLYFYFKNKNEMLRETILRERDHFVSLLMRGIETREGFAEKLFACCVAMLAYMKSNPALMSVMHWMQYQNLGPAPWTDDLKPLVARFDFLNRAARSGELVFTGGPPALILVFIFFFLMNESRFLPENSARPAAMTPPLGRFFSMLCHGIGAERAETHERTLSRSTPCPKQSVSSRHS